MKCVQTMWPCIESRHRKWMSGSLHYNFKGCVRQLVLGKQHAAASRALSGPPTALICLIFSLFRMCI